MSTLMTNTNYIFLLFAILALIYGHRVDLWRDNKKAKYIFMYFAIVGLLCTLPKFTSITFMQVCIASRIIGISFMMWIFVHILLKRERGVRDESKTN